MKWDNMQHFWLVILSFCVALGPRFLPLLFFRKRKIPNWFNHWMEFIPISLFTSLVVKDIFITKAYTFSAATHQPEIIASIFVILISYWTRSMALSVVAGLAAVFTLTFIL